MLQSDAFTFCFVKTCYAGVQPGRRFGGPVTQLRKTNLQDFITDLKKFWSSRILCGMLWTLYRQNFPDTPLLI